MGGIKETNIGKSLEYLLSLGCFFYIFPKKTRLGVLMSGRFSFFQEASLNLFPLVPHPSPQDTSLRLSFGSGLLSGVMLGVRTAKYMQEQKRNQAVKGTVVPKLRVPSTGRSVLTNESHMHMSSTNKSGTGTPSGGSGKPLQFRCHYQQFLPAVHLEFPTVLPSRLDN